MDLRLGCWSGLSLGLLRGLGSLGRLLLLRGLSWSSSFGLAAVGRGPEGQVVAEELHDEGAVTVRLLRQRVELSNGIVESLLGKVAGTVGGVQNLVVEHGEVESQSEADRVGGGKLGLGNVGSVLQSNSLASVLWIQQTRRITL